MSLFALCFEAHAPNGHVWALKHPYVPDSYGSPIEHDANWTLHTFVDVLVPMLTVYRGQDAPQPRAYFVGTCATIERVGSHAVIR